MRDGGWQGRQAAVRGRLAMPTFIYQPSSVFHPKLLFADAVVRAAFFAAVAAYLVAPEADTCAGGTNKGGAVARRLVARKHVKLVSPALAPVEGCTR